MVKTVGSILQIFYKKKITSASYGIVASTARYFDVLEIALSKRDSLTVSAFACHAADPGSNPGGGEFIAYHECLV